jgi:NADH-quinone oxidoreductase subunit M
MISHGFISGALFLCVGVLYDRLHSRQIKDYGGVANKMPVFAAFMMLFAMANTGLPGTSGFVGEFLVILGAFQVNVWYKRVIFGAVANDHVAELADVSAREIVFLAALAAAVLLMGLWPKPFLDVLHTSVDHLLTQAMTSKL